MLENRRGRSGRDATNGPAKLCQALGIDKAINGHDLRMGVIRIETGQIYGDESIIATTRIGISRAKDMHRRYYLRGNPYVSHVSA